LYTLTKSISYNEALQQLHEELKDVPEMDIDEMLSRIPDRKPLPGDEI
jgi:hypothetical protein